MPGKFAELTIMGGAIYAKGNTHVTAEFNIYADPEAAHVVFERWPKVRVLSWETTMAYPFNGEQVKGFFGMGTPKAKFFHDIYQNTLALPAREIPPGPAVLGRRPGRGLRAQPRHHHGQRRPFCLG